MAQPEGVTEAKGDEYKKAGVNYGLIQPFKDLMKEMGLKTTEFPKRRGVFILDDGETYEYLGSFKHSWRSVQEGLGNKGWIAQWMYENCGTGKTYHDGIAFDLAMMGANDVLARGALPVIYHDEAAPKTSEWFKDKKRNLDFANGTLKACVACGMALVGGESPAYKYIVGAEPPIGDTPVFSCTVIGIIAPYDRRIRKGQIRAGDVIIGATSSGWHSNGASLIIKEAMKLPDRFLTKLDNKTLGEHALIPTRCYVSLAEAWHKAELDIHAIQPITGDGVSKVAFDKRPFTYVIADWPKKIVPIFLFMRDVIGISIEGCLKTFNWGIGIVGFFSPHEKNRALDAGIKAGYEMYELGVVKEGERKVIFGPEGNIPLPPPGE